MKNNKKRTYTQLGLGVLFALFIGFSYLTRYMPGVRIAENSGRFLLSMITLFPGAFILIGLFEVWVDRGLVERHLGKSTGLLGYFWVILLACTVMAPLIIALPLAHSLAKKGARLSLVIGFLGASTVCRIPMTIFESTYLGVPFSIVRLAVSIPIIIIFSEILGRIFANEKILT
jgi:uncharacterized membrane protein YraQ (UPF0718 family)